MAWPILIGTVFFFYRPNLTRLIDAFTAKFENADDIKVGSIELKGARMDPTSDGQISIVGDVAIDGNDYATQAASLADRERRNELYDKTRSLMLAHRIRPSRKKGQTFDISIFLVRKSSKELTTARFQDVSYVEYYFGKMFGEKPNGGKFIVRTPDNGFAMTTSAYGSPLCVAKIHFQDGEVAETYRYLDFEMAEVFGSRDG